MKNKFVLVVLGILLMFPIQASASVVYSQLNFDEGAYSGTADHAFEIETSFVERENLMIDNLDLYLQASTTGGSFEVTYVCVLGGGEDKIALAPITDTTAQVYNFDYENFLNGTCNADEGNVRLSVGIDSATNFIIYGFLPNDAEDAYLVIRDGDFDNLILDASSNIESALGISPSEAVVWTGNTLIKPILGGGLATLFVLRYWIIALVVLSIIVFFAFRAFRFYRR